MKNLLLILFTLPVISYASGLKTILFLGDSLTEGYGIQKKYAYPEKIKSILKNKAIESKILNGGVSGSTTASGKSRLRWFLKAKPEVMVLALGANDGLRGIKVSESKKNLLEIIELAQKNNIKILLCGMQVPPNYGKSYADDFQKMFKDLAKKYKLEFMPFLLKDIAGEKKLNIEDGVHPNEKGHQVLAENLVSYLEKLL